MLTSRKLLAQKNIRHGFFNRNGGKSKGIYKSLNCGLGSNDKKNKVNENLKVVKNKLNKNSKNIFLLHQVHSNKIVYIDSPGGSVLAGVKIIDQIEKYQMSCIASKAISMGFVIFQSCHNRLVTSSSQLMQHQISFGIKDEIRKIWEIINMKYF